VHVGTEDGVDRRASKAHVAYQVDDLAGWRGRLLTAGFSPETGIPLPGYDRFECRDPFGNRFEMIMPLRADG
jgi:catechol 2,3-dioxygenase-like lactoylglutathione lyase family enzyme